MNVIVVGAGVIGVAIADRLAAGGASVTVLDMRAPGRGASQASAGMLAPYTEALSHPELLELGTRSLALFDGLVTSVERDTGRRVEYRRTGTLEVAFDRAAHERLAGAHREIVARGAAAELLTPEEIRRREPTVAAGATAALFTADHGFVGVESLVAALAQRARFAGAVFASPAESLSVEERGSSVEVRVGTRVECAECVVIAAGSWSGRVRVKHLPVLPVRPVRGQLLHLHWPDRVPPPASIVWGPNCYTVPWSTGTLLVGATMEEAGFDERPTAGGILTLTDAIARLLPAAREASFESVRVGLRPALPDGLPAIGPLGRAPRVVLATGHYRNGVLLAPITAEIVARYVLSGQRDPAIARFSPDRVMS